MAKKSPEQYIASRFRTSPLDDVQAVWMTIRMSVGTIRHVWPLVNVGGQALPGDIKVGEGQYFRSKAERELFDQVITLRVAEAHMEDALSKSDTLDQQKILEMTIPQIWLRRRRRTILQEEMVLTASVIRGSVKKANSLLGSSSESERATLLNTIVTDAEQLADAYIHVQRLKKEQDQTQKIPSPGIAKRVHDAEEALAELQRDIVMYPSRRRSGYARVVDAGLN